MPLLCPRIHFYEIDDQSWFPSFLRARIQSCLTLAWTFRIRFLQRASPAQQVVDILQRVLGPRLSDYTYVDFCAGAGGPTPTIERLLNDELVNGRREGVPAQKPVQFYLTDLHPHPAAWTEAAAKSDNLKFVAKSVDATNAPSGIVGEGAKVFRLYNLAFHHFDDALAGPVLDNSVATSEGFAIFELQHRTLESLITILMLGPLFMVITPFYFWRDPIHLFFTYVIPIIPFVIIFDGYVSSLRTRTPQEVLALMNRNGKVRGWNFVSGSEMHTWPMGYLHWVICVKE